MHSTCFEPGRELIDRVAKTYNRSGEPVPPWQTGAIAPAGMLRSTVRDMLAFVAANVDRVETPLRGAIRLAQRPRYQTGTTRAHPQDFGIGLGWFIDPKLNFLQHNGETNGSSSDMVFDPQTKIGVVVLMNQAGAPATSLARKVMRLVNSRYLDEQYPALPRDDSEDNP
jgi:CubicO group peptidase (beta-lactamase class C family)